MKYYGKIQDKKDLVTKEYVDDGITDSLSPYRTASAQDTIDSGKQDVIDASNKLPYTYLSGTPSIPTVTSHTTLTERAVYNIDGYPIEAKYDEDGNRIIEEYATKTGLNDKLSTSGNGSNVTAAFTQASSRANISTGEKLSVLFGKIAKWFADLKTVAFTGSYSDLSNKPSIPSGANDISYTYGTGYDAHTVGKGLESLTQSLNGLSNTVDNKEAKGKITISGVEKTANSHTVTIVTNGVTTNLTLVGVS